jgi:hypothetical protein
MISRRATARSLQRWTDRTGATIRRVDVRRGRARRCRDGACRPSRETRRCFDSSGERHGCMRSSGAAHPPITSMLRGERAGVAAHPRHGATVVDRGSIAPARRTARASGLPPESQPAPSGTPARRRLSRSSPRRNRSGGDRCSRRRRPRLSRGLSRLSRQSTAPAAPIASPTGANDLGSRLSIVGEKRTLRVKDFSIHSSNLPRWRAGSRARAI